MESLYQYVVSNKKIIFVLGLGVVTFIFFITNGNNENIDLATVSPSAVLQSGSIVLLMPFEKDCKNGGGTFTWKFTLGGSTCSFPNNQVEAVFGTSGSTACKKAGGVHGQIKVGTISSTNCVLKKPLQTITTSGTLSQKRVSCGKQKGFYSSDNNTCYKGAL